MPGFNGKGPRGTGPMTGGCRGYCVVPLDMPERDIASLKDQVQALREELEHIEASISKIEKANASK